MRLRNSKEVGREKKAPEVFEIEQTVELNARNLLTVKRVFFYFKEMDLFSYYSINRPQDKGHTLFRPPDNEAPIYCFSFYSVIDWFIKWFEIRPIWADNESDSYRGGRLTNQELSDSKTVLVGHRDSTVF